MDLKYAVKAVSLHKNYKIWKSPAARLYGPVLGHGANLLVVPWPLRRRLKQLSDATFNNFGALQDVSFHLKRGKCLGIIGRNGSGKSTLLQIIAGTLQPTAGTVTISGRLAALLELGSGFNPDFTGRENVFINAAILGLSTEEAKEQFEKITSFAGIGNYVDQPIKRYSSGMIMRLAFAVSCCLNPELLIIDEALAVGDEAFQSKCFHRLQELKDNGCSILLVSHSVNAVMSACDHALLLEKGKLLFKGSPKDTITNYHRVLYGSSPRSSTGHKHKRDISEQPAVNHSEVSVPETQKTTSPVKTTKTVADVSSLIGVKTDASILDSRGAEISNPKLVCEFGRHVDVLTCRNNYIFSYDVTFEATAFQVNFMMLITTKEGMHLGGFFSHPYQQGIDCVEKGTKLRSEFKFRCLFQPGTYFISANVQGKTDHERIPLHRVLDIMSFKVNPCNNSQTHLVDFYFENQLEVISKK
jgi:lipopolysaccharide transport system ATP-binding protein